MKDERTEVAKTIGQFLRDAREAVGLSQEALALRADIHRTYPSLLELGKRQPTIDVFLRICKAVKVEPHVMIRKITTAL